LLGDDKSSEFESPIFRFKKGAKRVDVYNYTRFFKENIRKLGVAREISIPINSKLAVIYPENYITDNEAKQFYRDIVLASKKVFKISLSNDSFSMGL